MSRRSLTFAGLSVALALAALTAGNGSLAAQQDAAPAAALDDATIVAIFDNANTFDIETGKLAAKRGQSKEVREFGAMLAALHGLSGLRGAEFDRAFLQDMAENLDKRLATK
jgi:predicted outer membrane protein